MTKRKILAIVFFLFLCTVIFSESYRFDPGIYYLLDGRINVRSEPNLSGRIIGQLNTNSQVNIIECAFNEQIMDDVSAYWYKIEYNNSFGYIWGGFIAVETLVHDSNNNGINDYFHYRVSRIENGKYLIHINKDTFIYIDGNRIQSNFVSRDDSIPWSLRVWNGCRATPDPMRNVGVEYHFSIIDKNFEPFRSGRTADDRIATIVFRIEGNGAISHISGFTYDSIWDQQRQDYYREQDQQRQEHYR
jgi:hypothetical protein